MRSASKPFANGLPVLYRRFSRLLEELEISRADGSLPKLRSQLAKTRLLILDDWGLAPLDARRRQDLLDLIDDCHGAVSLALTSQLPVDKWHDYIGDPTIADAILDRIIHSAHRIELKGESLRKPSIGAA
ncbi:ATP-binding protein [Comamonas sp.]|uniref:ATP-binding protein n=1 Tax=Comamonas sp. TaxID=34028 RepID=UPI003A91E529